MVAVKGETVVVGRRTALGGMLLIASRLATRLVDLGTMLVLTRFLSPGDFGLVAIAASIVAIFEAALELPVYQVLVRVPDLQRSHYDTAFTLGLLRGLALTGMIGVLVIPVSRAYGDPRLAVLMCVLSLAPAMRSLTSPKLAFYQKALSFWRDIFIEVGGKLVAFLCAIGIAVTTRSYWAIPAGTVMFPFAMATISYVVAPYRPRLSLAEFPIFLRFITWSSASQIIGALNWQCERLLLGKFKSATQLGLFTTASDVANIPFLAIFVPITRPLLAAFSHQSGDRVRQARSYQKAATVIVMVGLPLVVGVSLAAEPLVRLMLGERWQGAVPLLRWLSLSLIPAVFAVPAGSLIVAFDEMKVFVKRSALEFCVKLPIAVIGVVEFGFAGVIAARLVSETVVNAYSMLAVKRLVGLSVAEQVIGPWRSMASTALMTAAVLLVEHQHGFPATSLEAATDLAVIGSVGAIVYAASSWLLWRVAGQPDGAEQMAVSAMRSVLRLKPMPLPRENVPQ